MYCSVLLKAHETMSPVWPSSLPTSTGRPNDQQQYGIDTATRDAPLAREKNIQPPLSSNLIAESDLT